MRDVTLTPVHHETPMPGDGPLVGWGVAIVLCLEMVFEVFGSLRRTSGSTDPQIDALNWAWSAVALRAAIALAGRERTWWSIAYLALIFVLPIVAEVTAKWWRATL